VLYIVFVLASEKSARVFRSIIATILFLIGISSRLKIIPW
jgi:hypothetical protein